MRSPSAIIRTCRRLGIETVLAVSGADADSVPARMADKTIAIGSYLDVDAVVAAAAAARADAIHPGYGFLSENPRLAQACEAAGVVFIGPSRGGTRGGRGQARGAGARGSRGAPGAAGRTGKRWGWWGG